MNKKLSISHNAILLQVHASENDTEIVDSYRIHSIKDMSEILDEIMVQVGSINLNFAINHRTKFGMINEWRVHNLLYCLGIKQDRTKSVNLNTNQPWYAKLAYFVLSPLYFNFI